MAKNKDKSSNKTQSLEEQKEKRRKRLAEQRRTFKTCEQCGKSRNLTRYRRDDKDRKKVLSICKSCELKNSRAVEKEALLELGSLECENCHQWKKLEEFSSNKSTKTGYNLTCNDCTELLNPKKNKVEEVRRKRIIEKFGEDYHFDEEEKVVDGKKYCPQCEQTLPVSNFWTDEYRLCGYRQICKKCLKSLILKVARKKQTH